MVHRSATVSPPWSLCSPESLALVSQTSPLQRSFTPAELSVQVVVFGNTTSSAGNFVFMKASAK